MSLGDVVITRVCTSGYSNRACYCRVTCPLSYPMENGISHVDVLIHILNMAVLCLSVCLTPLQPYPPQPLHPHHTTTPTHKQDLWLCGVLLNKVGGAAHGVWLSEALAAAWQQQRLQEQVHVFGCIPKVCVRVCGAVCSGCVCWCVFWGAGGYRGHGRHCLPKSGTASTTTSIFDMVLDACQHHQHAVTHFIWTLAAESRNTTLCLLCWHGLSCRTMVCLSLSATWA